MLSAALPFADAALDACFASFRPEVGVLLAVSGGPDSLALLHLAQQWQSRTAWPGRLCAATVDHGLRPEAAAEAAFVADACKALTIPHVTLRWAGKKPVTGLQSAARDARYALLADAALSAGCSAIATAHTLDDQAETVMMRLAHGSGLDGLTAMRPVSTLGEIRTLRPLLDHHKTELLAALAALGQAFIDDPSNADSRFERVRWRRLMPTLARTGLDAARLATFARRAGEAANALERIAQAFPVTVGADGAADLDRRRWEAEPRAIRLRVLANAIRRVDPAATFRLERLESLEEALAAAKESRRRTLAGLLVEVRGDHITLRREAPRKSARA